MRKSKYLLSLVLVVVMISAITAIFTGTAIGESDVFDTGAYYTVQENFTSDKVADAKAGTLITASASGQALRFKNSLAGDFEVEFRPLAQTTGTPDFTKISFYVRSNDSRYGFYMYLEHTGFDAETKLEKVRYGLSLVMPERVYGWGKGLTNPGLTETSTSSFINQGEIAKMGFDVDSKEVYVYNSGVKKVMLDLDSEASMNAKRMNTNVLYKGFSSYNVEIVVDGITGTNAQFLLYSVNGQNLSGANNAGPSVSGNPRIPNAVLNQEYVINPSSVTTFDFIDGFKSEFKGEINAVSPGGDVIPFVNNKFTPTQTGSYGITFLPVDDAGVQGVAKTVEIDVLGAQPEPVLEIAYPLFNQTVAKDTLVYFPSATAFSKLDKYNTAISPVLSIKKDGAEIVSYSATSYSEYMFTEEGEYVVEISATDVYGETVKKSATITVSSSVPYLTFVKQPKSIYSVDTSFTVPVARVEGGQVSTIIEFPDGRRVNTDCVQLDALGTYKLTYIANVSGNTYEYVRYFNVDRSAASLLTSYSAITSESAVSPDYSAEEYRGVKITGSRAMSTARWANVIDLRDNTKDNKLIEFFVMPEVQGEKEYSQFRITLTDIYNDANKVILEFNEDKNADKYKLDISVCANKDGIFAPLSKNIRMSVQGAYNSSRSFGWYPAISSYLYYDYATNTIGGGLPNQNNTTLGKHDLVDLTDEEVVGIGNAFKGFTTGEVYLDISFVTLASSSPDMLIMNVDGQDLSTEYVVDTTAPFFSIDFEGNDENDLPLGVVGTAYPIYSAIARDNVDGLCVSPDIKIYAYDALGGRSRYLNVSETSFMPEQGGKYGIEYTASDKHGNVATKTIYVDVVDTLPSITYDWMGIEETAVTGEKYIIPEGESSGGSGKHKKTLTVTLNDEPITITDNSFVPEKAGDYIVTVKIEDYLKNVSTFTKTITISANPEPVFVRGTVPEAVVLNKDVVFAPWKAYDYSSGDKGEIPVTIKVKKQGADESTATTLGSDRKFKATEVGVWEITFSASIVGGVTRAETYTFVALDLTAGSNDSKTYLHLANYFATENLTIERTPVSSDPNERSFYFGLNTSTEGGSATFVNALPADGFNVRFTVPQNANNFDRLVVTLVDSLNPEQKLVFEIQKDDEITKIVNGKLAIPEYPTCPIWVNGEEREINGSFRGYTGRPFEINYDNDSFLLRDYVGITITNIHKGANGLEWKGFESGKVYMSLSFVGVTGPSSINLSVICDQAFNLTTKKDITKPTIIMPSSKPVEFGEMLVIPAASAFDVLSDVEQFTVTVTSPSGQVLINNQDATKEYSIEANEYGDYNVNYYVKDSVGNETTAYTASGYIVTVRDKIAPTLTINGTVSESITPNKEFTPPSATVTDNRVGGSATLTVYWILPSGEMVTVGEDGKISADYTKQVGKYTLLYYGEDVDGYTVIESFTVIVG